MQNKRARNGMRTNWAVDFYAHSPPLMAKRRRNTLDSRVGVLSEHGEREQRR